MRAEQDKELSGDHLAMMTSMSGFKLAVSFLFNSATEAMATATRRARQVTVLSILLTIQPSKLCKPGVVNVGMCVLELVLTVTIFRCGVSSTVWP